MRIDLTGTNIEINGELRALVAKRFAKIKRRVPEDVHCEVILAEEHNPKIADGQKAEANLHIKGGTINAKAHERDMAVAIGHIADEVVRQLNRRSERPALVAGPAPTRSATVTRKEPCKEARWPPRAATL